MDFHHQLKGAIIDALDEGLLAKDPTRKVIIKGKTPRTKKAKYLLIAKTGMRFSEAVAITPKDFDFLHQSLTIDKTWDYKGNGGFLPTKNHSSIRKIRLDWQTVIQFFTLIKELPPHEPIFITPGKKIYNSTVNDILERHCLKADIPVISIHGLRHTHSSL